MLGLFCRACVRAIAWLNGALFGCAEDAVETLRGGGFAAEAEAGFRAGARWTHHQ